MVVVQLFELGMTVVFTFWNANAGRADVGMAVLVVLVMRVVLVEKQFGINCVGWEKMWNWYVWGVTRSWVKRERHLTELCVGEGKVKRHVRWMRLVAKMA